MWKATKEIYGESWRFALALPWLVAIPVIAELVQHGIEYRSGMYESFAGVTTGGSDATRDLFGHAKELTLYLMGYWVVRFMAFGHDPKRTVALPRRAVTLFVPVLVFEMGRMLPQDAGFKVRVRGPCQTCSRAGHLHRVDRASGVSGSLF
jgi:hypothetical protein